MNMYMNIEYAFEAGLHNTLGGFTQRSWGISLEYSQSAGWGSIASQSREYRSGYEDYPLPQRRKT